MVSRSASRVQRSVLPCALREGFRSSLTSRTFSSAAQQAARRQNVADVDEKGNSMWVPVPTSRGRTYYWHQVTGAVQWHVPGTEPNDEKALPFKYPPSPIFERPMFLKAMKYTLTAGATGVLFVMFGGFTLLGRLGPKDRVLSL